MHLWGIHDVVIFFVIRTQIKFMLTNKLITYVPILNEAEDEMRWEDKQRNEKHENEMKWLTIKRADLECMQFDEIL